MKKALPTKRSIYKKWNITPATLDLWIAQGVDIHDDGAMACKVADKQPSSPPASGSALHEAKLRKLTAEARTAEMRADEQDGKLISIEELTICLTKIGSVLKAQMSKLRGELPPMLYGLTEAEISRRIGEATDRTLNDICDELQEIKTEPPRPE
jgi:hypothetical protein